MNLTSNEIYNKHQVFIFRKGDLKEAEINETLCAICYRLYNLKNVKNTHGGVLPLVKLHP